MSDLRLRMKVWTDPDTEKRYLVPMALLRSDNRVHAYLMTDEDTRGPVAFTQEEWNALPFYYFKEDGECLERRVSRVPDAFKL